MNPSCFHRHLELEPVRCVSEPTFAVIEEQPVRARRTRDEQVEVAVAIHVAQLEITHGQLDRRQVVRRGVGPRPVAAAQEELALAAVVRAEQDVATAVAVEVGNLDHPGGTGEVTEHCLGGLLERSIAGVEEDAARLGLLGRLVPATVGEQDVGVAVRVEIRELDAVRVLVRLADGLGRHVHPRTCVDRCARHRCRGARRRRWQSRAARRRCGRGGWR